MKKLRLLLLALLWPTAACYSFAQVPLEKVAPGSQVRVGITPQAADRFGEVLTSEHRTLDGDVRSREGGVLLLDVVATTRQVGFQFEQLRQTLRLEPSDLMYVELKQLDRTRTYVCVGVATVVIGAIAWKALTGWTGGNTQPPSGDGTADARVVRPWFRIPVPFP